MKDLELYYLLIEDIVRRNSQLLINEELENVKPFNETEGVVFRLKKEPVTEVDFKRAYEVPGLYVQKRIGFR